MIQFKTFFQAYFNWYLVQVLQEQFLIMINSSSFSLHGHPPSLSSSSSHLFDLLFDLCRLLVPPIIRESVEP